MRFICNIAALHKTQVCFINVFSFDMAALTYFFILITMKDNRIQLRPYQASDQQQNEGPSEA